jgi:hypothetical protein
MRSETELRCFHEVGHCVSALGSERYVYEVTISPNAYLQVGKGGPEYRFAGGFIRQGTSAEDPGSLPKEGRPDALETDETRAIRIARIFAMTTLDKPATWQSTLKVIRDFQARSEALLTANWRIVQKLAEALEIHRTLGQSDIARLVGRA